MNVTFTLVNARINRGYQDKPAITINEQGTFAFFQVSVPKYDAKAENKTKWINISVRVLNKKIVERIQKLNLTEGAYLNLLLELDSNEFTRRDGTKTTEITFNVLDFDIPKAQKPTNTQQNGNYPQMPAQNNVYPMQNQYAGQPMGQMPPAQGAGYPAQGIPQGVPAQPTGTFTVLPDVPQQPAQQPNAFVAPVNGGFTGFEAAGQAMGIPNDGSAFMGGFGEG